jgi:ribose-phosphate pyrophosphokinase
MTTEPFAREPAGGSESPRGRLLIASCRSGDYLASQVVEDCRRRLSQAGDEAQLLYMQDIDYQFSDSETCVRLDRDVSGCDAFLFQALYDPLSGRSVDEAYMAFLLAARAFRQWGANYVTGVTPYLAYARQDKPTKLEREPTTARLMADLSALAGLDRLVTWHPHSRQIHGFYGRLPVDALGALGLFVEEFRPFQDRDDVIVVAPDAGASDLVTYLSRVLNLRSAFASKYRPRPEETQVSEIIGDFRGKRVAIVLDDIISSGGTVYALVRKLVEDKGIQEVYLGVSHNLCLEPAQERLMELHAGYNLTQVVVTDSIPQPESFRSLPFVSVRTLSALLSLVVNYLHYNRSAGDLVG